MSVMKRKDRVARRSRAGPQRGSQVASTRIGRGTDPGPFATSENEMVDSSSSDRPPNEKILRIARAIDNRRKQLGMTLQKVADQLGMSVATVHALMNGNHSYPTLLLDRLLEVLQWSRINLAFALEQKLVKDSPLLRKVAELLAKADETRPFPRDGA
jgi:transcriptional regulator with XRE-family HTH domain